MLCGAFGLWAGICFAKINRSVFYDINISIYSVVKIRCDYAK